MELINAPEFYISKSNGLLEDVEFRVETSENEVFNVLADTILARRILATIEVKESTKVPLNLARKVTLSKPAKVTVSSKTSSVAIGKVNRSSIIRVEVDSSPVYNEGSHPTIEHNLTISVDSDKVCTFTVISNRVKIVVDEQSLTYEQLGRIKVLNAVAACLANPRSESALAMLLQQMEVNIKDYVKHIDACKELEQILTQGLLDADSVEFFEVRPRLQALLESLI